MHRTVVNRLLITALGAIVVIAAGVYFSEVQYVVILACAIYLALGVGLYKLDYLHPSIAFLLPWMMILMFSVIPLSRYSRPVNGATYQLLLSNIFAWMFACAWASPETALDRGPAMREQFPEPPLRHNFKIVIGAAFVALYMLAAINIAVSGYVPLLSLLTTGDSRYLEFGVPSVYGAFLAFANACGCVAFYFYLRSRRIGYLILFISVLAMHVCLVTRQNIITLLVEIFVIRCLTLKRLSTMTMLWCIAGALAAFSLLGTLRSGDAKEIFGVEPQYMWVPTGFVWLYAYSYFNALNIDNLIVTSGAPYFDGFMWQTLLPSILRPASDHESFVEMAAAAASSYVFPVYMDIGKGVILWTGVLGSFSAGAYRRALRRRRFLDISVYGCLFSCALLSFFVDFWLYLPVSFQLVYFWMFHRMLFRAPSAELERAVAA